MYGKFLRLVSVTCLMTALTLSSAETSASAAGVREFQERASKYNSIITLPRFETTTNQVASTLKQTITNGNAALDKIGALQPKAVSFKNTILALDDAAYQIGLVANRFALIKETSTNEAVRDAATDAVKELEEWMVGLDYREDVYKTLKAYADTNPKLAGEDAKLYEETMRDYRRAGLELPKAQ